MAAQLFHRRPREMALTNIGATFLPRVKRALALMNSGADSPRLPSEIPIRSVELRTTAAQLKALLAIKNTGSYSAAARELGLAQPTVYRAAKDLEIALNSVLFEVKETNVQLTRTGETLQKNVRLAFGELTQGLDEVATMRGQTSGRIRIGALPLARATILAPAIDQNLEASLPLRVEVDDGPYSDLLQAVRTGALDVLVGALRTPHPSSDIHQEPLFLDRLGVFCGPGHPLLKMKTPRTCDLRNFHWVLPRPGTPTRSIFDQELGPLTASAYANLVETSSMVLMRALLQSHHRLTLISRAQVATEVRTGQIFELPIKLNDTPRPIGFACRTNWYPTDTQNGFLENLRAIARRF